MGIQILQKRVIATEKNIKGSHLLCVLSDATSKTFPFVKELDRKLKRAHKKWVVSPKSLSLLRLRMAAC